MPASQTAVLPRPTLLFTVDVLLQAPCYTKCGWVNVIFLKCLAELSNIQSKMKLACLQSDLHNRETALNREGDKLVQGHLGHLCRSVGGRG